MTLSVVDEAPTVEARFDDWTSAMGGIGSFRDKHVGVSFAKRKRLSEGARDALYEQNGIAARIVDLIVDDAMSQPWRFKSVDGCTDLPALRKRIEKEIGLDESLVTAGKWSRKDGFALLTIPTDANPTFPLPLGKPTRVMRCAVEPRRSVQPDRTDDQIGSDTYRKTLYYRVTTFGGDTVYMHRSHCVAFEPIQLSAEALLEGGGDGMGPSVLDRVFDQLSRYGSTNAYATAIMYVASLLVINFKGYADDYKKTGGPALLRKKAQRMRADMDALGVLLLDEHDKIANVSHNLTGIFDCISKAVDALCAVADAPREILMNEPPTGLRGGELSGARALWNKRVESFRKNVLTPAIEHVLAIVLPLWGYKGSFEIEWPPLWEPDEITIADVHSKNAVADAAYYGIGALSERDIRKGRFVDGNVGKLTVEPEPAATPFTLDPNAAPIEESATPADEAMNGAQIANLVAIMTALNRNEITYVQAHGALGVAFPTLKGREGTVLGPPPPAGAVPPVAGAPAATPSVEAPVGPPPSNAPPPGDAKPVREAAAMYGVRTRTITRLIDKGLLGYWGFGTHKIVSLAELATVAKAHEQEVAGSESEPAPADDPATPEDESMDAADLARFDDCKRLSIPLAHYPARA